jgi:hypothetical protein
MKSPRSAPKELIKTRTAMKGLEVLASDPNRNILVSFANGFFQKRQRRIRIFERGSQECPCTCRQILPLRRLLQSGSQTLRG